MIKLTKDDLTGKEWDGSKYLKTEKDIKLAIEIELEDYNPEAFKLLLRDIAKARLRMNKTAKTVGVSRSTLYRQLSSKGKLSADTLLKIISALGFTIKLETAK